MIQAYNFLFSWQLFPEKGTYAKGDRPKSGIYKLSVTDRNQLAVEMNWVTLENQAFASVYEIIADGQINPLADRAIAEEGKVEFIDSISMQIMLFLSQAICYN